MIKVHTQGKNFARDLRDGDKVPYLTRKWGKGVRRVYQWITLNEEGVRCKSGAHWIMLPYDQIVSYTLS